MKILRISRALLSSINTSDSAINFIIFISAFMTYQTMQRKSCSILFASQSLKKHPTDPLGKFEHKYGIKATNNIQKSIDTSHSS
jgi:hypothetical protein